MPADKTRKLDKVYCLSDDSVNCYGYRLLTSGYQIAEYQRNPIGYYMHDRDGGVVLRWEDIYIKGGKVFGTPVINLAHPRAEQTIDEVENGFLNAASVGHIVPLEWSEEAEDMLQGQTGPTITKWYNQECSLVDIPGNKNAMCLFDQAGNPLQLADLSKSQTPKSPDMKGLVLSLPSLTALGLKADATDAAADIAVANLAAQAAKADTLQTQLSAATAAKETAEKALAEQKKGSATARVADLLGKALKEGKVNVALQNKLSAQYDGRPDELAEVLDLMSPYTPVTGKLSTGGSGDPDDLMSQTWDELDKSGKLADLKANNYDGWAAKFEKRFGKAPKK